MERLKERLAVARRALSTLQELLLLLTVHTYNEAVAEDIYSNLPRYGDLLAAWLAAMEGRIEPR